MALSQGDLVWVPKYTPPINISDAAHFFIVMLASKDHVLWTSLTSVKYDGKYYDKTCELVLPEEFLRHPEQDREVYVRYDRTCISKASLASNMGFVGRFGKKNRCRIVEGLQESPDAPKRIKLAAMHPTYWKGRNGI